MASSNTRRASVVKHVLLTTGMLLTTSFLLGWGAWAFFQSTTSGGAGLFWPDAQAALNLRLGCPKTPLANWGPCWDDAAADAAERWNSAVARFRFSRQSPSVNLNVCAHGDSVNTVAFASKVCDSAFGANILAVTISTFSAVSGALNDADVVFNSNLNWSTYSGPFTANPADLHRVAVHEFGHVLGLAHPDQHGQVVNAIMNSAVIIGSSIESPQADDIAGANTIYPSLTPPAAFLENPTQDGFVSGISTISGWVCNAGRVDVQIDGAPVQATYGTSRTDTIPQCGDDNNGFGVLYNWNLLANGLHTLVALADGVEFARVTFTVTSLGQEFLTGVGGSCQVPNFAGHTVTLQWQESLQNFMIVGVQ
jgi:matrixin